MSTIHVIKFLSDLSGEEIPKDEVNVVSFSIDGTGYEIDLNDEEAAELRDLLAPYIGAGRKARAATKSAPRSSSGIDNRAARVWLLENGYPVKEKGRIPAEMLDAYAARRPAEGAPVEDEDQEALFKTEETPGESSQAGEPTDEEVIAWHESKGYTISKTKDGRPNGLMVHRYKKAHVA